MAAAMNGLALHGGIVPYGGTFLVFTDYCRPAIRLSALMGQRVIYVMTHDSIGLGEDGPTHQPVEHLAALRAMPEPQRVPAGRRRSRWRSAGSWRCRPRGTPSILALTRQAVPALAHGRRARTCRAKGAYVLAEAAGGTRDVTILATGSEVGVAMEARERLGQGRRSRRQWCRCRAGNCSRPSRVAYREAVLGSAPRVGRRGGGRAWAGSAGWARAACFIGMAGLRRLGAGGQAVRALRHHRRPSVAEAARQADQALHASRQAQDRRPASTSRASACWCAPISTCRSRTARSRDATRLERLRAGARRTWPSAARACVVISHFGRPERRTAIRSLSLKPVAEQAGRAARPAGGFRRRLRRRAGRANGRGAAARRHRRAGEFALPRGRGEERSRVRQAFGRARATSSSTTPSLRRIARMPRPTASRGCCRPMPGRC